MIIYTLLFLLLVIVIYMLYLAMKRINEYENLLVQIQTIVNYSTERMKLVDNSGHYESDDETGFFFEELKRLQLILDNIFEIETEESKNAESKKEA